MRIGRRLLAVVAVVAVLVVLASCGSGSNNASGGSKLEIVVAENFWGSIVSQLAGDHAVVSSIIVNPATDPHDYEATSGDARLVAQAQYVVYNGIGYDHWMNSLLSASPSGNRTTLNVGDVLGLKPGDNPHQWYSPASVDVFIRHVSADLESLDTKDAAYFAARERSYESVGLRRYRQLITAIGRRYSGIPVGASESIFSPLAAALHLELMTPQSFVDAIAEGNEPTANDKITADHQITHHQIKVFVFNTQNATPDVQRLVDEARAAHIPIATVTETLSPANLTFQAWQVRELEALQTALAAASAHKLG